MAQLRDLLQQDTSAETERLNILIELSKKKLQEFKVELQEAFLNPGFDELTQVRGKRIVRYYEEYRANITQGYDSSLDEILDNFFTGTGEGVKSGFKSLIKIGLATILGKVSGGESQQAQFFVVPENNAFIRVDVKAWRYEFSSTGVISNVQNAFCFIICKSIVDHTEVSVDELIYLVTDMAGPNATLEGVKKLIADLRALWSANATLTFDEVHRRYMELTARSVARRSAERRHLRSRADHGAGLAGPNLENISAKRGAVKIISAPQGYLVERDGRTSIAMLDATAHAPIASGEPFAISYTLKPGNRLVDGEPFYLWTIENEDNLIFNSVAPQS